MVLEKPSEEGETPVIEIESNKYNKEYGGARGILSEYVRTTS